ncbi:hypothetical protein BJ138DRAFT_1107318, partial [Hygrophoropsis aurantiaca]
MADKVRIKKRSTLASKLRKVRAVHRPAEKRVVNRADDDGDAEVGSQPSELPVNESKTRLYNEDSRVSDLESGRPEATRKPHNVLGPLKLKQEKRKHVIKRTPKAASDDDYECSESDSDSGVDTEVESGDDSLTQDNTQTSSSDDRSGESGNSDSDDGPGPFDDVTFEGFGPGPLDRSDTPVEELVSDACGSTKDAAAVSSEEGNADEEIETHVKTEEDPPQTPMIRKSTRRRKVTAKIAALVDEKMSTPSEWEDSEPEPEQLPSFENVTTTSRYSAVPPANE